MSNQILLALARINRNQTVLDAKLSLLLDHHGIIRCHDEGLRRLALTGHVKTYDQPEEFTSSDEAIKDHDIPEIDR